MILDNLEQNAVVIQIAKMELVKLFNEVNEIYNEIKEAYYEEAYFIFCFTSIRFY